MLQKPTGEQKYAGDQRQEDDQRPINQQLQENAQAAIEGAQHEVATARVPRYHTIKRGQVLLAFYALQLALFAVLAWWVHYHPVLAIDVSITREFQENQAPWLKDTMIAVSFIGNVWLLSVGLLLLAAVILWILRLRLEAVMLVAISATSSLLNGILKIIVERPRPTASLVEVIQKAGGQSFPSGHVMAYLAFWGFLFSLGVILFKGNRWWRIALLIVPALFVVLVGPSRIYLGDHWASDVLGAYLIGGVWLGLSLWVYLSLKKRGVLSPNRTVDGESE